MKKFYLISFCFSLVFSSVHSQITILSDDIAAIGYVAAQTTDETPAPTILEGGFGNIDWDFNDLQDGLQDTFVFLDPSTTPYADTFPMANLASKVDTNLHAYMIKDQDKIEIIGLGGKRDVFGLLIDGALKISPGQSLIRFPATYGESYQETVVQQGQVTGAEFGLPTTVDSVRLVTTVNRTVEIDAYGMMSIPSGTYETLRSTETETSLSDVFTLANGVWQLFYGLDPDTIINYNWWTIDNGSAFPVVQMEYDPINETRSVIWLKNLTPTENLFKTEALLFPNPACDFVNVDFQEPFQGTVELYELSGKRVSGEQLNSQTTFQFNLSTVNSGIFVIILKNQKGNIVGYEKINVFK